MSARTATYDILTADATVLAQVSTRLFMPFAPNGTALPFIVFRSFMEEDTYTKDNDSTLDIHRVELDIYHNTIADAETLGGYCRDALQGYRGTINGVTVQGCRLDDEDQDYDVEQIPIWTQDYSLRIAR